MQYCTKHNWPITPKEADKFPIKCEYLGLYSGALTPNEINGFCFRCERPITEDSLAKECLQESLVNEKSPLSPCKQGLRRG